MTDREFRPLEAIRRIWGCAALDIESKAILQAIVLRTDNATGSTKKYPENPRAKLRWIADTASLASRTVSRRMRGLVREGYVVVLHHWSPFDGSQKENSYELQLQRFAPVMARTSPRRASGPAVPAHVMASSIVEAVANAPRAAGTLKRRA